MLVEATRQTERKEGGGREGEREREREREGKKRGGRRKREREGDSPEVTVDSGLNQYAAIHDLWGDRGLLQTPDVGIL